MKLLVFMVGAFAAISAQAAGPFAKFESRPAIEEFETLTKMEDVERCLIDIDGMLAPNVYRQPDRPDQVRILWIAGAPYAGVAGARIDLKRSAKGGTSVKSWLKSRQVRVCAP